MPRPDDAENAFVTDRPGATIVVGAVVALWLVVVGGNSVFVVVDVDGTVVVVDVVVGVVVVVVVVVDAAACSDITRAMMRWLAPLLVALLASRVVCQSPPKTLRDNNHVIGPFLVRCARVRAPIRRGAAL